MHIVFIVTATEYLCMKQHIKSSRLECQFFCLYTCHNTQFQTADFLFLQLDMSPYMIQAERGDAQADEAALNLYQLHAVLIHKGDVHSGHYTCCANLGGQ